MCRRSLNISASCQNSTRSLVPERNSSGRPTRLYFYCATCGHNAEMFAYIVLFTLLSDWLNGKRNISLLCSMEHNLSAFWRFHRDSRGWAADFVSSMQVSRWVTAFLISLFLPRPPPPLASEVLWVIKFLVRSIWNVRVLDILLWHIDPWHLIFVIWPLDLFFEDQKCCQLLLWLSIGLGAWQWIFDIWQIVSLTLDLSPLKYSWKLPEKWNHYHCTVDND
jgi:hypothetical protein